MRRLITWLWMVPVPLTFAFELLIGTGWLLVLGNILAVAIALPVLIRVQRRPARTPQLWLAVIGLLAALGFTAAASTVSITTLWLSLVALTMLIRTASNRLTIALIVILAAANIIVPSFMLDGLIYALMISALIIAAAAIGLMLRSNDRTLVERQATAAEAERRRIATELHDLIAHEVTGIVVLAQAAGRSGNDTLRSTALSKIEESGTRALDEIRRLVSDARRESASRTPIAAGPQALRDRIAAFGDTAQITIDIPAEADAQVWPVLDRVLVESLTNVRRHAGADAPVTVTVSPDPDSHENLMMIVTNGPGSGGIGAGSGTGLSSLRIRVGHLGGQIDAGPAKTPANGTGPQVGGGWTVRASVPMRPDAPTEPHNRQHPKESR